MMRYNPKTKGLDQQMLEVMARGAHLADLLGREYFETVWVSFHVNLEDEEVMCLVQTFLHESPGSKYELAAGTGWDFRSAMNDAIHLMERHAENAQERIERGLPPDDYEEHKARMERWMEEDKRAGRRQRRKRWLGF